MTSSQLRMPSNNISTDFSVAREQLEVLALRIDRLADWAKSVTPHDQRLDGRIDEGVQMAMDALSSQQDEIFKTLTATPCVTAADTAVKALALLELIPPKDHGDLTSHLARSLAQDVLRLMGQRTDSSQVVSSQVA